MNAPSREAAEPVPQSPKIALFVLTAGISLFIFSFCTMVNFQLVSSLLCYPFYLTNKDNLRAAIVNTSTNGTRECVKEYWSNFNNESDYTLWQVASESTFYLNIAPCVIGIFPTAVLGAWGDVHNRKHAILVPVAGSTIGAILFFILSIFAPDR